MNFFLNKTVVLDEESKELLKKAGICNFAINWIDKRTKKSFFTKGDCQFLKKYKGSWGDKEIWQFRIKHLPRLDYPYSGMAQVAKKQLCSS